MEMGLIIFLMLFGGSIWIALLYSRTTGEANDIRDLRDGYYLIASVTHLGGTYYILIVDGAGNTRLFESSDDPGMRNGHARVHQTVNGTTFDPIETEEKK